MFMNLIQNQNQKSAISILWIFSLITVASLMSGCGKSLPTLKEDPILEVNKDSNRMKSVQQVLQLDPSVVHQIGPLPTVSVGLKHLADLTPPKSKTGLREPLQATAFEFTDDTKFGVIVYNYAGEDVEGAVDIVKVGNPECPELMRSYSVTDAEFNDVKVYKSPRGQNFLLAAGNHKDHGAFVRVYKRDNVWKLTDYRDIYTKGNVATSIDIQDDLLMITSGDPGILALYDLSTLDDNSADSSVKPIMELGNATYAKMMGDTTFILSQKALDNNESFSLSILNSIVGFLPMEEMANYRREAPGRFAILKSDRVGDSLIASNSGPMFYLAAIGDMHRAELKQLYFGELNGSKLPGTGNGIDFLNRQYVILAQGEAGAVVVDTQNYRQPKIVGRIDFHDKGSANSVKIGNWAGRSDRLMFLGDGLSGVRIVYIDL